VATVLDAPAEKVGGSVFNVGATAENFRKQDLVEFILARLPGTKVERVARTEDPRDYRVSFEKVKSTLGLEPTRTVPQGIDEILELLQSGVIADPFGARYRN
jgi:nucleoside-diphosphate-sugar epimerase